jgi:hypothetical protein
MKRHLALTVAGAAAIFVTAASGAVAANVGILNVGSQKPVGALDAASVSELATPPTVHPTTVTSPATDLTVPVESGAPSTGGTSTTVAHPSQPTVPSPGPAPVADPSPAPTVTTSAPRPTETTTSTTTHREDHDRGGDDD